MSLAKEDIAPGALIRHDSGYAGYIVEILCLSEPNEDHERAYFVVSTPLEISQHDGTILWLTDDHVATNYSGRIF